MKKFILSLIYAFSEILFTFAVKTGAVQLFAKIKYPEGTDIRGSIGGTTHSKGAYGNYTKSKSSPTNPQTPSQSAQRTSLTTLSQAWRELTDAQRKGWNDGAGQFRATNVFGDTFTYTGFNLYLKFNLNLATLGVAAIDVCPQGVAVQGLDDMTFVSSWTADTLIATFSPALGATTDVAVYATPGLSAGVSTAKSEYRFIAVLTDADTSPAALQVAYREVFGAIPPVGSKVFLKFVPIENSTGIAGTGFTAMATTV